MNNLKVVLQVNSQAKSPALKDWVKKYSTHRRLATISLNTSAEDKEKEYLRVLSELTGKGKKAPLDEGSV